MTEKLLTGTYIALTQTNNHLVKYRETDVL